MDRRVMVGDRLEYGVFVADLAVGDQDDMSPASGGEDFRFKGCRRILTFAHRRS